MHSEDQVLRLIGRIYDAAADPRAWQAFLEDLAAAIDGTAGLFYHDMTMLRATIGSMARVDPECARRYVEQYSSIDPYRASWLARFDRPSPEAICTGEQLIDWDQVTRTEYHNDFARVHDVVRHLPAPIVLQDGWAMNVTCNRSARKGPFGTAEIDLLRILFPHLQRAIQFHRRFAELEGSQRASLDALDHLPVGVILLDQNTRIVAMNREAHRVLDLNDGLSAAKDGLKVAASSAHQKLLLLIAGAASTASGHADGAGGPLTVSRPSGKRDFTLLVAPATRAAFAPGIRTPAVVVFVTDPEKKAAIGGSLARIYELTPAESRLANLLMQGETLVRAAERLGVSHNTARTHLQRIYEKTNTSHQADLVRVLLPMSLFISQ